MSGERRLRTALHRLGRKAAAGGAAADPKLCLDPTNAFEVAMAEQIRTIRDDVDELKSRLNWLSCLILGAAVANVVLALLG